jgi:hypothetical protein
MFNISLFQGFFLLLNRTSGILWADAPAGIRPQGDFAFVSMVVCLIVEFT